jgi:hypothetical protein
LLVLRESYLFGRNCLGLVCHPFKTLNRIFLEKDISQGILICGLPFYLLLSGFILIKSLRFLIGAPRQPWGPTAKFLGVSLVLITLVLAGYLLFWFWQTLSQKTKFKRQALRLWRQNRPYPKS